MGPYDGTSLTSLTMLGPLAGLLNVAVWYPYSAGVPQQMSRSEQLLRERMRATGSGITWYDYSREGDLLVSQDGPRCVAVRRKNVS